MNEQEILTTIERVLTGQSQVSDPESLEGFCAMLHEAAPQPHESFQGQLEYRLRLETENNPPLRLYFPKRIRLGLLVAVLLLTSAVIVYAMNSLVQRAIETDPGLKPVEGQILDLDQTIDGYTLNLEWAYADTNRISLTFHLTVPENPSFITISPESTFTLTDQSGHVFPLQGGLGTGVEDSQMGTVYSFDSSVLPDMPDVLQLRLEIQLVLIIATDPLQIKRLFEPFIFEFAIPVSRIQQRAMKVPQTVEDAGIPITLQRVDISDSQTRFTVCFTVNDPEYGDWVPVLYLYINGQDVNADHDFQVDGGGQIEDTDCQSVVFHAPLAERTGQWVIEIHQLIGTLPALMSKEQIATLDAVAEGKRNSENGAWGLSPGALEQTGLQKRINGLWRFVLTES